MIEKLAKNDQVCLSIISLYELNYSLSNTKDTEKKRKIEKVILWCKNYFEILPLTLSGSEIYGELKTQFRQHTGINRKAIKKHNIDLIIASTAIDTECTLVARDYIYKNHLVKLDDRLIVEDWTS